MKRLLVMLACGSVACGSAHAARVAAPVATPVAPAVEPRPVTAAARIRHVDAAELARLRAAGSASEGRPRVTFDRTLTHIAGRLASASLHRDS
jgi:hypothetical protein